MNGGFAAEELEVHGPQGPIVESLTFRIEAGRALGLIGESGSGKSMTARALVGLLPAGVAGRGTLGFGDLQVDAAAGPNAPQWREIRGRRAVLLMQDPFTSLSPVHRCGVQIAWSLQARPTGKHRGTRSGGENALLRRHRQRLADLLDELRLPHSALRRYPHELSGGQRQRVAIAAAMACEPELLIADEPTTALDAAVQAEVLDLLRALQREHRMAMLLISHDLGLIRGRADDVMVMQHGRIVEQGPAATILDEPRDPYTRALLDANPSIDRVRSSSSACDDGDRLLVAEGITKSFAGVPVVRKVDICVRRREVLALVGESGSGKSTLARCLAGLESPDSGRVVLDGVRLPAGRRGRNPQQMQMVFQDPYSSLNPVASVRQCLAEALRAARRPATEVPALLRTVGLDPSLASRRPSRLSGGQRQRVAIARALAPRPGLLICDESVSALDVIVQAEVLEMLRSLRDSLDVSILFITHDLAVVADIADRVAVMRTGVIVEEGPVAQVLGSPRHPYTRHLAAAARGDTAPEQTPEVAAAGPEAGQ